MSTLYELNAEMQRVEELLADFDPQQDNAEDHEVFAAMQEWKDKLAVSLTEKMDNYAALVRDLELLAEVRRNEATRLMTLACTGSSRADWLRANLLAVMQERRMTRVDTPRFRVTVCQNGGLPPIEIDEDQIPDDFLRHLDPVADRVKIREALLDGLDLPFVRVLQRGYHVRIK